MYKYFTAKLTATWEALVEDWNLDHAAQNVQHYLGYNSVSLKGSWTANK